MQRRTGRCSAAAAPGDAMQLLGVSPLRHAVGVLPALRGVDHRTARHARELLDSRPRAEVRALSLVRLRDLLGRSRRRPRSTHGHQHAPVRSRADGSGPDQGARRRRSVAHAWRICEARDMDLAGSSPGTTSDAASRGACPAVIARASGRPTCTAALAIGPRSNMPLDSGIIERLHGRRMDSHVHSRGRARDGSGSCLAASILASTSRTSVRAGAWERLDHGEIHERRWRVTA
jgi:hypothetical protein